MIARAKFFLPVLLIIAGLTCCVKENPEPETEELGHSVIFVPPKIPRPDPTLDSIRLYPELAYGSVTDTDGNIYKTIQIGTQIWMAENLRTTKYNDGSSIILGKGGPAGYTEWFDIGGGAYCWYDNDTTNRKYGAIYNWHAVGTGKLCPSGWHVPDYSEWTTLISSMGGLAGPFNENTDNAGINWGNSENVTNTRYFNPDPGGCLYGWGFINLVTDSLYRYWWTSTPMDKHLMVPYSYIVSFRLISDEPQSYGYNVRCLKD